MTVSMRVLGRRLFSRPPEPDEEEVCASHSTMDSGFEVGTAGVRQLMYGVR